MPAVVTRLPILLLRMQCWSSLYAIPGAASERIRTWQTMCRSSNSAISLERFQVLFGLLQEILLQYPGLRSAVSPLHTYPASCASANSERLMCPVQLTHAMQHALQRLSLTASV